MTAATETYTSFDRSPAIAHITDNTILPKANHDFFTSHTNAPRVVGHCLDDADILTLKRQYANFNLFEQSFISNSAEDISQLDRLSHQPDLFGQGHHEIDEDDFPYDDAGADYFITIEERLKKANEEFQKDETPVELKHEPRIQFDAVVKAVDIVLESDDQVDSSMDEAPSSNTHEYTVPLNDTKPKEGLSLVEQIKAIQFHNMPPTTTQESEQSVSSGQNSMIVSVNGRFDLQNEDDYIAKQSLKSDKASPERISYLPTPPTEPKKKQDKPPRPFLVRPKSSESARRVDSSSNKKSKADKTNRQRPTSAGVSKSIETYVDKPPSGVDFDELLREAAVKKRAEMREERRRKAEEEEKRNAELARAKEYYERWLEDKNSERKRINEEKRLEKEEEEARRSEQDKELNELREKRFKEWLDRKTHEASIANQFQKLKASEEDMALRRSSFSPNHIQTNGSGDHRAFRRWLRQKHEQALEEKRRIRFEIKQQRRRERRSIKRHQLQQDIQLAKSYGYS
ncbi:unnamed protein product [Adineta ricciae]|uniref:Coiled-coil domain-containing protein 181 n=1 Tax=Adineta ricciae TaxID=249248 RepID=A0A814MTU1_ADIRI|nr:unnamed protein product [Adineta ricciae]CAF1083389.1 unnamed protein product [Adineta ricciae]